MFINQRKGKGFCKEEFTLNTSQPLPVFLITLPHHWSDPPSWGAQTGHKFPYQLFSLLRAIILSTSGDCLPEMIGEHISFLRIS